MTGSIESLALPTMLRGLIGSTEAKLKRQLLFGLAGDALLYGKFLDGLSEHLRAFLRRHLPHRLDDVEDILQETLLAVHDALPTYQIDRPLTAWARAIARYKLMDFFRRYARREALHEVMDDELLFATSGVDAADAHRDVLGLLDALSDRHRVPIQLVKLQGLSVAEAARCTGLSESAIKIGIHRGLKLLARRVQAKR
jgi:RNA polymerase sigma-70 factor (ECF subfamily)